MIQNKKIAPADRSPRPEECDPERDVERETSIKTFVAALAVTFLVSTAAWANGQLRVTVLDGFTAVEGATVTVTDSQGNKHTGTTERGPNGEKPKVDFDDIPPGDVTIDVEYDDNGKKKTGSETATVEDDKRAKAAVFVDEEEGGQSFLPIQVDSQPRYLITLLPGVDAAQWIADHNLPAEARYFHTVVCPEDEQLLLGTIGKRNPTIATRERARDRSLVGNSIAVPISLRIQDDARSAAGNSDTILAGNEEDEDRIVVTGSRIPVECYRDTIQTPLNGTDFSNFSQQYCNPANGVGFCGVDTCPEWQFPAFVKPTAVSKRQPTERRPNFIRIVLKTEIASGQLQDSEGNGLAGGSLQLRPKDPDISTALDDNPSNDPPRNDGPVVVVQTDRSGGFRYGVSSDTDYANITPRITVGYSFDHLYGFYNFNSSFTGGPNEGDLSQPGDTWIGSGATAAPAYAADRWQLSGAYNWASVRINISF